MRLHLIGRIVPMFDLFTKHYSTFHGQIRHSILTFFFLFHFDSHRINSLNENVNVSAKMNLQQLKNAFQIEPDESKKCSRKFTIIDCFLWLCCTDLREWFPFLSNFFSARNAWENERTIEKNIYNTWTNIYKSISLFRFIWLRYIHFVSFHFISRSLARFSYPFPSNFSTIELIWCIYIRSQKSSICY